MKVVLGLNSKPPCANESPIPYRWIGWRYAACLRREARPLGEAFDGSGNRFRRIR